MYLQILNNASLIILSFTLMAISFFVLRDIFYKVKVFGLVISHSLSNIIPYNKRKISEDNHEE